MTDEASQGASPPSKAASLLADAEFARSHPPRLKRLLVNGLIGKLYKFTELKEADVFRVAYSDDSGEQYWACWLTDEKVPVGRFADVIARHLSIYESEETRNEMIDHLKQFSPSSLRAKIDFGTDPLHEPCMNVLLLGSGLITSI